VELWQWQGTVDEVRQWFEHDAKATQTLYEQALAVCNQPVPDTALLRLLFLELMAKYRKLSAMYLASLLEPAHRAEKAQQGARCGGKAKAQTSRLTLLERNAAICQTAATRRDKNLPRKDLKRILARKYGLSAKQIGRILASH
jgi:hypothetical protein